jgi:peptidoglycan/LPS O-acetylase OafA/YrhL
MTEPLPVHPDHPGKSRRHIPGLDGIRGLAILLVMLSHFLTVGGNMDPAHPGDPETVWHRFLHSGYLGVDLFFVLSGFLITGILIDAKNDPHYFRTFYIRRSLRIFPLYYGLLACAWLSVVFITPEDGAKMTGHDSMGWFWAYSSNIGMAVKGAIRIAGGGDPHAVDLDWLTTPTWIGLGHFWSLAVEEQFYLVWPLLVFLIPVRGMAILSLLMVLSKPFMRGLIDPWIGLDAGYTSTLTQLGTLGAGALMAILWRKPGWWYKIQPWFKPVALVSLVLLVLERTFLGPPLYLFEGMLALILGSACVGIAALGTGVFAVHFLASPVLRWLGKYSYGIYVYHHALRPVWIEFLWNRWIVPVAGTGWPATLWYTAAASVVTFALAWLSWKFIEGPILSLKDRFNYRPGKA